MDHLDMTEQLRKKAKVSYEEARDALEASNWDMLEAMVHLEQQGKIKELLEEEKPMDKAQATKEERTRSASEGFEKAGSFISRLVEKGNRNRLEVRRDDRLLFSMPLTVLVLVGLLMFWLIWPGMLIGWVFGWRYSFQGPDMRSSKEYQPTASGEVH